MATRISTGVLQGIGGLAVTAEVDLSRGLPGFHLVGLPNTEVRESRDRVLAALRNSGVKAPPARITINLAPAGVRKEGASCDLAMAVGVVAAAGDRGGGPRRFPPARMEALFLGELSLFGEVRPVRGLLPILLSLARTEGRFAVVPARQAAEARLAPGYRVIPVATLAEALSWLATGRRPAGGPEDQPAPVPISSPAARQGALRKVSALDGQPLARKAAILAAVGGHNLLLVGPPGSGKTRLVRLLADLQPDLEPEAALEVTRIHSAAGLAPRAGLIQRPPLRAPHHSTTAAGLAGGGSRPSPGEVTLAHRGILFLDELPEFRAGVLEVLREPLEEGRISLVRAGARSCFPADFQLIAAMNPCRCGNLGSGIQPCACSPGDLRRYRGRLSGPLLDRFDLFVELGPWRGNFLRAGRSGDHAAGDWRVRPDLEALDAARRTLRRDPPSLSDKAAALLDDLRPRLGLSLRGVLRCARVAATAAALDGAPRAGRAHVREVLEFRREILDTATPAAG